MNVLRALVILFLSTATYADYLRFPAPSPDGTAIAFSARGDLWIVDAAGGTAVRLTSNPGYDSNPVWSPDGSRLAFSSDRYGNDDLFSISREGLELKRHTFASSRDLLCDWSPDGKNLLFYAWRDFGYHWQPSLYEVDVRGGTPFRILQDFGAYATYGPTSSTITYVPRTNYYFTKGYMGAAQMDIFMWDRSAGTHRRITDWKGDDVHAMWLPDGSGFYYISDHDRVSNLWFVDLASGTTTQKTFYTTGDITFPRIARNGSLIAYEYEGGIHLFDTASGETRPLNVTVGRDPGENPQIYKTFTSEASSFAIGEEGTQIALSVRGDIFAERLLEDAKTQRLTASSTRDDDVAFSPDEKTLYFVSDREGSQNIYAMTSDDPKEPRLAYALKTKTTALTEEDHDDHSFLLSPDGEKILYVVGTGELWVMGKDGANKRRLVDGWNVKTFSWSPDGKFIAFSREDNDFNEDIFILPVEGDGTPFNLTRHPAYDSRPRWSPDGKYLAFISNRYGYKYDVFYVWLTKEEDIKTEEQRLDEEEAAKSKPAKEDDEKGTDKKKKDKDKDKEKKDEKPAVTVKIDKDDIWKRVRRLTETPGEETDIAISSDSKKIAYVSDNDGKKDLYIIDRTGKNEKKLTDGGKEPSHLAFTKDGSFIYFLAKGGSINKISADGSKNESIAFKAGMMIDLPEERAEVFKEGWSILNNWFYDPKFHGVDWKAMLEKYLPLARQAVARRDFDTVMLHMLGELNASHLGIYPPDDDSPYPGTGYLGIDLDPAYSGAGFKILRVLPKSPADDPVSPLKAGDVITSVNDHTFTAEDNFFHPFQGTAGQRVALGVQRDGKELMMAFIPISSGALRELLFQDYVDQMRAYVHDKSGGKLGYIAMRYMDQDNLDLFSAELYAEAYDKDGILIDVRNNGGGWTTDLVLNHLAQKPHAVTIPRGGGKGYPDIERKQIFTWKKPFIVLCNQDSFSNAEIFSHAIKTLGLAKLVGVETNGSVISTDGTALLDGSYFRIPTRGWYTYKDRINMEDHGAVPDYIVVNPPEIWGKDHKDLQVDKAVDVLLTEVAANPGPVF
ncbi:MAG TPA: S41 family peptidase [Thermoanaerobaculia bacterium]|nr:S41 family peptidase [Thermoanaerobaculia bacterium]HUM29040.1 S41 family peptidase [Thermoanaerobaculia bacterium]HXK67404.1 S41 family peptidase [Thermoanaerobaculia bacterium]